MCTSAAFSLVASSAGVRLCFWNMVNDDGMAAVWRCLPLPNSRFLPNLNLVGTYL